jgi:hypothetical protein
MVIFRASGFPYFVHCKEFIILEDTMPSPENGNIQFPKRRAFLYLEFWTVVKVQKPSNSECCTPPSEPFRF